MIVRANKEQAREAAVLAAKMWDASVEELTWEFEQHAVSGDNAVFLYYDEEEAVGFAHAALRHDYVEGTDSTPVGYLEGVFVKETYRCRGVAKSLVKACEAWAASVGCMEFASDCELDNVESLAFHLKMGFIEQSRNIHFAKVLGS